MKLLCLGDIAIMDGGIEKWQWPLPESSNSKCETKVLFNWELPIGTSVNPNPRVSGPRLLSSPNSVNVINKWAPGYATLATNHIFDAGEDGLAVTITALNQAGFQTVGAGLTSEEIVQPLFWEAREGRVAIINWVFPETHPDWLSIPGPNCWPGLDAARQIIRDLKGKSDWVMVVAHWSDELFPYPRPEDRRIAFALACLGADLIVSHHAHVVRGMEWVGKCPVFYGIGNYFFSNYREPSGRWIIRQAPRNRESIGVLVTFQNGMAPEFQVFSFWNDYQETILDPKRRAVRRYEALSSILKQRNGEQYLAWYQDQRRHFDGWGYRWNFGLWNIGFSGVARWLGRWVNISRQQ